jgi:hypothetical protein
MRGQVSTQACKLQTLFVDTVLPFSICFWGAVLMLIRRPVRRSHILFKQPLPTNCVAPLLCQRYPPTLQTCWNWVFLRVRHGPRRGWCCKGHARSLQFSTDLAPINEIILGAFSRFVPLRFAPTCVGYSYSSVILRVENDSLSGMHFRDRVEAQVLARSRRPHGTDRSCVWTWRSSN